MQLEANATQKSNEYFTTSPYGYSPDVWIGILFLLFFGASTLCHLIQAIHYRLWWLFPTVLLAGCMEIIGWIGRLWSSYNLLLKTPYMMQISLTILAPTPLVAANFIMLGQCIRRLGQQYSRLSAKRYTAIFLSCDIIALLVQGAGGGIASMSAGNGTNPDLGGNLMLAGIIFQLGAITIYVLLATEFVLRYLHNKPLKDRINTTTSYSLDTRMKQMLMALAFSSLCIYVRTWYRTIELANGWTGYIIHTQRYFVIMDALMITFAMGVMNIFHPGRLLGPAEMWKESIPMADMNGSAKRADPEYLALRGNLSTPTV
ncbi:RTA1-domain-containing protein [Wolfiporia cocos MD-104 SS10]|uniref:RTA1-domain-containing protein n=1 Tax=Wolfiporia cocos (strain MD-104) TaxID=742152 RepID=A0A2H3JHQ0_WOLCO|nr:RTA1-domain-containing protein [Wolfiporia cocos MD-104 SS10]